MLDTEAEAVGVEERGVEGERRAEAVGVSEGVKVGEMEGEFEALPEPLGEEEKSGELEGETVGVVLMTGLPHPNPLEYSLVSLPC